jgi:hypothetical protein
MAKNIKIVDINKALDEGLRSYIINIYIYMSVALAITGIVAIITISFDPIVNTLYVLGPSKEFQGVTNLGLGLAFTPLMISLYFFLNFANIGTREAQLLFWLYAALMGISVSYVGLIYTGHSITRAFFVCAAVFGSMSLYGYVTGLDLTSIGSFMVMGLIGIIFTSLINLFFQSPAIYFATSLLGVFIFMGLTAWDTQRIKEIYYQTGEVTLGQKMAILGALTLYLDVINLFLHLLKFVGEFKQRGRE